MTKKQLAKKLLPKLKEWEGSQHKIEMANEIIDKLIDLGMRLPEEPKHEPAKKQPFSVGDTVQLAKNHSWSLQKGEITSLTGPMGMIKVRLFDMNSHEVFASLPQLRKLK